MVKAHQVPATCMSRGVIYGCRTNEASETLARALVSDGVEILMARPMGKNGTLLISFASPNPPKEVLYWSFVKRVERRVP